ncbi:bifunctional phosphoribosylaminoimidazolecarboxamide formyltransferase/IMP cyclohydrolase [Lysinibacter sp. HNR]|uniref:bifunctional phosphoribosylaminoimidazolecarboxamide formyltransferase/IMP cyclohydrolase n=1 Tax=Lysinibacter sp. HNR TaxID=3031408 RepID=UPI0024348FDF|nr:bifunctional phosphoribosylaminoimidazolecarboxamide formyltransferase/IMP cyclohydrolase [Lysinibacter sp. HNR]WGD38009.1 bifunctional phosphoribosylaminoimidazolecarboxamide formyltransferase/IMP cyclohydrolase [Lysinibacter sp. HNR]
MVNVVHDANSYQHQDRVAVKRALISVSDKTGLLELAQALVNTGVEIVSTGSTAATMRDAGYPVTEVSTVTGFPESLDGRVKTLHPGVHAGLLADLRLQEHRDQLLDLGIEAFELAVVNLYPFRETVASGADAATVIENIDIGGPALVRASAKNHANIAIAVSPARYPEIISALASGGTTLAQRVALATEAFAHTAAYDRAVAGWFAAQEGNSALPSELSIEALRVSELRYGENSHQAAALYKSPGGNGIAQARLLHGKEMSYNNYVDADAALRAAYDFSEPAVAIIKHANPCGIAIASESTSDPIADAHLRAHECDPVSAFGGVIAANRPVTLGMANAVKDIFTEVLVAPSFHEDALAVLTTKKNLRLLQLPDDYNRETHELRQVSGGFLMQSTDVVSSRATVPWTLVAGEEADATTLADLEFAWIACRAVKSNGILLAHNGAAVGVGMGQVNRVDSCRLAAERAGERALGAVAASDAFFPFADGLQVLLDAGVSAVVQPGGSIRDQDVIDAAHTAGITMYFTGERHFFH